MVELRTIITADGVEERVAGMSDERRHEIAEAQDAQHFFSAVTIATLRAWGRDEGCPIRIYMSLDRGVFTVGRYEDEAIRIVIPSAVVGTIHVLPLSAS